MKCFSCLLSFIVLLLFSFPAGCAEQLKSIEIQSISYHIASDKREIITFKLSSHANPHIFRLQGDKPRIVVDFPQVLYSGKNRIPADSGMLASGIRLGTHVAPVMKTRAVIDLSSAYEIIHEQSFSDPTNTLTIALSSPDIEKTISSSVSVPEKLPADIVVETIEPASGPRLLGVSFDDSSNRGEMVIFRLNGFYPPTVSAIEKDTPQVLCDFMDMELGYGVDELIVANGVFVERIHVARHENPDKVRAVLDLPPDRDYDLQQVFFKNDNLFVLIVNELPEKETKDKK